MNGEPPGPSETTPADPPTGVSFLRNSPTAGSCTASQCSSGDGSKCMVVMYHYVHDSEPMTSRSVFGLTTRDFKTQLDRLCREMEPIDWPSLYGNMHSRRPSLPKRCFLLTFDDGLADHAQTVLPILDERKLRGVFFVPGVILTTHRMLPAHAIHLLLSALGEETLKAELQAYLSQHAGDAGLLESIDTDAAKAMYHYETPQRAELKYLLNAALPQELRHAAVEALFERHVGSSARWSQRWYLGWDDLTKIQSMGHTIGGHGHRHDPYSQLTPGDQRLDARRVHDVLQEGLGSDIRPFSYPYGSYDEQVITACREAGFAHGFTTERDWLKPSQDCMRLPRIDTIDVDSALNEELACVRS